MIVNYFCAFSGGGHYAPIIEADESAVYLFDSTYGLCTFFDSTYGLCTFFDSTYGLFRLSIQEFEPFWHNKNGDIRRWCLALR